MVTEKIEGSFKYKQELKNQHMFSDLLNPCIDPLNAKLLLYLNVDFLNSAYFRIDGNLQVDNLFMSLCNTPPLTNF